MAPVPSHWQIEKPDVVLTEVYVVFIVPSVFEEPSLDGGKLKPMKGGPMTIHMKKGEIKPTHIYTARKCPYAFEESAKDE